MYVYYKYDSNGYFIGTGLVENLNSLPNNATFQEPSFDDNYWTKWNGKSWEYELKPKENDPELEVIEQQEQELANQLAELKDSILVAIATKDDEWLEELRAEYARLMGE